MKIRIDPGLAAAVMALGMVGAHAATTDTALATTDMTQMLAAIAHPDYAKFVAPASPAFKATRNNERVGEGCVGVRGMMGFQ